jgi:hypothetical protein
MVRHPFIWWQGNGHLDIVKALLATGVDVNVKEECQCEEGGCGHPFI